MSEPHHTNRHFAAMLLAAGLLHAAVFAGAALMPQENVTEIPAHVLSFRLGDGEQVFAAPAAVAHETAATPQLAMHAGVLPPPPAIAASPQQHVRVVGAPSQKAVEEALVNNAANLAPAAGVDMDGVSAEQQEAQAIRARYEQEIAGWIEQHKYYPREADKHEGMATVRMRIDRGGNVRYYAIEQSAGNGALDNAALVMIRRANPMPAVPENYPAGTLVEFLIPIHFKAPV